MLLYFRGFQSSVLYLIYTYIYFCSLSCNRTNCLHILLKKMTLVLPSGTFSPLTVFNICNCHYHLCNMSTAETFLISQWKIAMFIKLKLKLPLAPVYIYCYLIMWFMYISDTFIRFLCRLIHFTHFVSILTC